MLKKYFYTSCQSSCLFSNTSVWKICHICQICLAGKRYYIYVVIIKIDWCQNVQTCQGGHRKGSGENLQHSFVFYKGTIDTKVKGLDKCIGDYIFMIY